MGWILSSQYSGSLFETMGPHGVFRITVVLPLLVAGIALNIQKIIFNDIYFSLTTILPSKGLPGGKVQPLNPEGRYGSGRRWHRVLSTEHQKI